MLQSLNANQSRIFLKIISHLYKQYLSYDVDAYMRDRLVQTSDEPLFMFVSGVGGTGKSYLIKTLSAYVQEVFKSPVALMGPTGIAACNINGMTIHRLLQLPVQHGKIPAYRTLSDESANQLAHMLRDTKLFILDEISMVSNLLLLYIHFRLSEMTCDKESLFGGKNMLVCGDLLQLAPVSNGPCFADIGSAEKSVLKGISSINLWNRINYDELTINVRQNLDERFSKLLADVRVGRISHDDEQWLTEKCLFHFKTMTVTERLREIASFILHELRNERCYTILVPTNTMVNEINKAVLDFMHDKEISIVAYDSISVGRNITIIQDQRIQAALKQLDDDSRETAGLEARLNLKIGAKVMLRRNINVTQGLCNGSIGELIKISVNRSRVEALHIKFGSTEHLIKRVRSDFFLYRHNDNIKIIREQFPITLAYAMTVHKSQGLTLKYAMIDCSKEIFDKGQIYVALSRVSCSDNLRLMNFNVSRIDAYESAIEEYRRLGSNLNLPCEYSQLNTLKRKSTLQDVSYTTRKKRKIDISNLVNEHSIVAAQVSIGTFSNNGGFSCYANALMQCLFQVLPLALLPRGCIMRAIYQRHFKKECQSLDNLRHEIGNGFQSTNRQCPAEFLHYILAHETYTSIKSFFEVILEDTRSCSNITCQQFVRIVSRNPVLHIGVNITRTNKSIDELINITLQDSLQDDLCPHCNSSIKTSTSIISSNQCLVVKVEQCTNDNVTKNQMPIKSIPHKQIVLNNKKYKFVAMIAHCGELNPDLAHYIALLKKGKTWLSLSDACVTPKTTWPNNAYEANGKKSAYLLFYTQ